jgi:hypothetical protein
VDRHTHAHNRFNGFDWRETVETVSSAAASEFTPLKRGVNETVLRMRELLSEWRPGARGANSEG